MTDIEEHYKHVFVHHWRSEDELEEVNPDYVYMMIPSEYVCVYHKLLVYLADFGKDLLSDCSSACRGSNKTIVDCWNMFQSALACKNLGRHKEAELYINYIVNQLKIVYQGTDKEIYDDQFIASLDPNGHIYGLVSCGDTIKFRVDVETGKLIETTNEDSKHVFVKDEENKPTKYFTITGGVFPTNGGTINNLGTYPENEKVAISYVINENYSFIRFDCDASIKDIEDIGNNTYIITMNKDTVFNLHLKENEIKESGDFHLRIINIDDPGEMYGTQATVGYKIEDRDWNWSSDGELFIGSYISPLYLDINILNSNYEFIGWYHDYDIKMIGREDKLRSFGIAKSFSKDTNSEFFGTPNPGFIPPSDIESPRPIDNIAAYIRQKRTIIEPPYVDFNVHRALKNSPAAAFRKFAYKRHIDDPWIESSGHIYELSGANIQSDIIYLKIVGDPNKFMGWYYSNGQPESFENMREITTDRICVVDFNKRISDIVKYIVAIDSGI